MTDLFDQYFAGTREERKARLDGEALWNVRTPAAEALAADRAAVANPRADSGAVGEIADFLAVMLEFDPVIFRKQLRSAARKLLQGFGGNEDGLWDVLEDRGNDLLWCRRMIQRDLSPWLVADILIGDYARKVAQERKHAEHRAEWQEVARRSQEFRGMDEAYWAELKRKYLEEE